jgi:hypothetical protein
MDQGTSSKRARSTEVLSDALQQDDFEDAEKGPCSLSVITKKLENLDLDPTSWTEAYKVCLDDVEHCVGLMDLMNRNTALAKKYVMKNMLKKS